MASVGPKYPTSEVSSNANGGTISAQNTPNLDAGAGEVYWVFTPSSTEDTELLICTGFDFSDIPDEATILGITVERSCRADIFDGSTQVSGGVARLIIAGSAAGDAKAWNSQPQVEEAEDSIGGPADLWGATPTAAQVKASNFGVHIFHESVNGPGDPNQLYYKWLRMSVDYSVSSGLGSTASQARYLKPSHVP